MKIGFAGVAAWYQALTLGEHFANHAEHKLTAIADVDPVRRKGFAERVQVDRVYEDEAELANDPEVDVVFVMSETSRHFHGASAALKSGKPVWVNKPMTISTDDADALIRLARSHSAMLGMMHNYRMSKIFQRAKHLIEKGAIGRVLSMHYLSRAPLPEDWPASGNPGWYSDPALAGGGGFVDHAAHTLDIVSWFVDDEPVEVTATMANLKYDVKRLGSEDFGVATITFSKGAIATVESTWTTPQNGYGVEWIEVVGELAEMTIVRGAQPQLRLRNPSPGGVVEYVEVFESEDWRVLLGDAAEQFLRSVEGREQLALRAEDGRRVVHIVHAAYRSAERQGPVTLSAASDAS